VLFATSRKVSSTDRPASSPDAAATVNDYLRRIQINGVDFNQGAAVIGVTRQIIVLIVNTLVTISP